MATTVQNGFKRFRPLRQDASTRLLNSEVTLSVSDFIIPLFVVEGKGVVQPISSLQGVERLSVDQLAFKLDELVNKGYRSVLLFGVPDSSRKDLTGSSSYSDDALVPKAVKTIKENFPELEVITDVCLCAYTQHGHCGLLKGNEIDNDSTLPHLASMAIAHAQAGADLVAPSAMMDGQVLAIKQALVKGGFNKTEVLSYSAKFSSAYYGPFRDAANSAPSFGDRKTYQMDYRSIKQPMEEIAADIEEGALQVMVKPAMAYLDVLQRANVAFPKTPLVAYHVSGEYAMIKLAAAAGYLDESAAFREAFTAIKRAGANRIISYYTDSTLFVEY